MIYKTKLLILISYFTCVISLPAYAYLDPGTFSVILQGILAIVAGIAATYRLWVYKIKNLLNKIKNKFKKKNNNLKE